MEIWIVESRSFTSAWDLVGVFSTHEGALKALRDMSKEYAEPDMSEEKIMAHFRVKSIQMDVLFNLPNLTRRLTSR